MQTPSHLAVGSPWFPRMKMSHRRTAGPTGAPGRGEETRQRTTRKGIRVKPLTTYLQQEPRHKAIRLLLIHRLHMFAGGSIPTGVFSLLSHSVLYNPTASCHLFVKEGPESCASGAWNCGGTSQLSAMSFARNLHYLSPRPCLHVSSQGHWALRSLLPQMLINPPLPPTTPHSPNPEQSVNKNGCFIFTPFSTLCQSNS